jgi:N-acetylglucosamine kinase-like BadF-type ATPase
VSEQDRETIRTMARAIDLAPVRNIEVDHDLRIALAGGLAGNEGLVLIVGTGSSCYGRRANGKHHRTGWGYLLDDLGSGYFLGLQAMIAVIRAADGRGIPTTLSARIRQELKYSHIDEIMRILYHDSRRVTNVAALAPIVLAEAKDRDEAAMSIIERGAEELSLMVATVAKKLDFAPDAPLVIVGGVAEQSAFYRTKIESAIVQRIPQCRIQPPQLPPILGAVLLALEGSGHGREAVIAKLKEGVVK